jgi:hypothetical protein
MAEDRRECCTCCRRNRDRVNVKDHERYHKYWDPLYEQQAKDKEKYKQLLEGNK